jgi:hypothetical protein
MPDRGDPYGDELFTRHPDLTKAQWAKMSQRAKRRHIRRAWRSQLGGRTRRISLQRPWSIAVVVAVVTGALLIVARPWSVLPRGAEPVAPIPPTITATTRQPTPLDLNQPFANTPAGDWRDGANGIQPPPAAPFKGHSGAQVADALRRAKQALVAAHLDNRMLVNHDLRGYLALSRLGTQADLRKDLSGYPGSANTMLAPGFHLLPAPIKVNGTMSVDTNHQGDLVVHTNYVFAYPFAPSNPSEITETWQIVAIHHISQDFELVAGDDYAAADRGLWLGASHGYFSAMACGPSKQGLLAPAYSESRLDAGPDNENPDALYDPNHPLNIPDNCPP